MSLYKFQKFTECEFNYQIITIKDSTNPTLKYGLKLYDKEKKKIKE